MFLEPQRDTKVIVKVTLINCYHELLSNVIVNEANFMQSEKKIKQNYDVLLPGRKKILIRILHSYLFLLLFKRIIHLHVFTFRYPQSAGARRRVYVFSALCICPVNFNCSLGRTGWQSQCQLCKNWVLCQHHFSY